MTTYVNEYICQLVIEWRSASEMTLAHILMVIQMTLSHILMVIQMTLAHKAVRQQETATNKKTAQRISYSS